MTLTDELAAPDSPASRLLRDLLPERGQLVATWTDQLAQDVEVRTPLDWAKRAGVGAAFEWRLGFDLADTVPYADVLDLIPAAEAARLLASAGYSPGHGSPDARFDAWTKTPAAATVGPDADLDRDVWFAASFAEHTRKARPANHEQWRGFYSLLRRALLETDATVDVVDAMGALWLTYAQRGRQSLLALGHPRIIRPVFDDAFAVGDFVLGSTLVDVKVYVDPRASLHQFLDQLLGYVLFDDTDEFGIEAIGVYLGWQGRLLVTSLDEVWRTATGRRSFAPAAARRAFRAAVRPALERSRSFKHGQATPGAT